MYFVSKVEKCLERWLWWNVSMGRYFWNPWSFFRRTFYLRPHGRWCRRGEGESFLRIYATCYTQINECSRTRVSITFRFYSRVNPYSISPKNTQTPPIGTAIYGYCFSPAQSTGFINPRWYTPVGNNVTGIMSRSIPVYIYLNSF